MKCALLDEQAEKQGLVNS